jgi:rubrerythrin
MNITIVNRDKRRRYECFDCGLTISVRREFQSCPNCSATGEWEEMA